jgi:hypothetical protein
MPKPPSQEQLEAGFTVQITKVCDIGGGHETVTLNTHMPPGSSPEALYGKLKVMRQAMQKEIDFNRELELRRADQERKQYEQFVHEQGTRSPVDLPDANALLAQQNGHQEQ